MTVDTSTKTVQALIAAEREVAKKHREDAEGWRSDPKWNGMVVAHEHAASVAECAVDTLAALLDERDALTNANARVTAKWSQDIARAERAEADRDFERGRCAALAGAADRAEAEVARLTAVLDAVKDEVRHYQVIPGDVSQPAPSYYVHVGQQVVADRVAAILTRSDEMSSK